MNYARKVNGRSWRVCVYRTMRGWAGFVEGGRGNREGCRYVSEHGTFCAAAREVLTTLRRVA